MSKGSQPTTTPRARNTVPEIVKGVPQGLETGLRNYWYPVLESEKLPADSPVAFKVLGEQLVAWRDAMGKAQIARDKCPHRAAKLSQGRVIAGSLQCPWHGVRFGASGQCTFIPWENDSSPLLKEIRAKCYPCEELGGFIWGYIGDTERFPPPALADCIPEEFSRPDTFVIFRHPSEVWDCNWLQTLDGVDGFHAIILHGNSQAVANEKWEGGRPKAAVPIENRRMQIIETSKGFRGIALDQDGNRIHHGHLLEGWRGDKFILPGLHSLLLVPAPGAAPFASRHYQIAVDATHTLSVRFVAMRAESPEQRAACEKLWHDVVAPRQLKVSNEDRVILENLGTLEESREDEFLFQPDIDIVKIRRQVAEAFIAQIDGEHMMPTKEALVCPA